jgi:hypothetical protein
MTRGKYFKIKSLIKEVLAENAVMDLMNHESKIKKQIQDKFRVTPMVTVFDPYVAQSLKGKVGVKIQFKSKEFPDSIWNKMLNFLKSKEYNITSETNMYELEDDRYIYPTIKFDMDV